MDKLFYIIYNSYYKHGNFKNDIPVTTVGGIFLFCVYSIFTAVLMVFYWINAPHSMLPKTSRGIILFSVIIFGAITYFLFFYNKRHLKIYERYKDNLFLNSFSGKILGFTVIIFIYLMPLIICFLRNITVLGRWF